MRDCKVVKPELFPEVGDDERALLVGEGVGLKELLVVLVRHKRVCELEVYGRAPVDGVAGVDVEGP